jgi:hypothetical protein
MLHGIAIPQIENSDGGARVSTGMARRKGFPVINSHRVKKRSRRGPGMNELAAYYDRRQCYRATDQ